MKNKNLASVVVAEPHQFRRHRTKGGCVERHGRSGALPFCPTQSPLWRVGLKAGALEKGED